jgi:hypothetical protein
MVGDGDLDSARDVIADLKPLSVHATLDFTLGEIENHEVPDTGVEADVMKFVKAVCDGTAKPIFNADTIAAMEGKALSLTLVEQVRYNGADFSFSLEEGDIDLYKYLESWHDLTHGKMLDEMFPVILIVAMFGVDVTDETLEAFANGDLVVDSLPADTDIRAAISTLQSVKYYKDLSANECEEKFPTFFDETTGNDS